MKYLLDKEKFLKELSPYWADRKDAVITIKGSKFLKILDQATLEEEPDYLNIEEDTKTLAKGFKFKQAEEKTRECEHCRECARSDCDHDCKPTPGEDSGEDEYYSRKFAGQVEKLKQGKPTPEPEEKESYPFFCNIMCEDCSLTMENFKEIDKMYEESKPKSKVPEKLTRAELKEVLIVEKINEIIDFIWEKWS